MTLARSAARLLRSFCLPLLLAAGGWAHADIYGYVDERGTAHFAAEKLDARYQLFFKEGQRFDTAEGLGRAPALGEPGARAASLIALFEKAPSWRTASPALKSAAARHDLDVELLQALVAAESGFNTQAISPKGAIGLMQLMPATAERYGVRGDARRTVQAKLHDPQINIAAGSRYLRDLIAMFDGSLELALAAYNAGEGAVQRAGNRIPNYRETQNYVKTVLALYAHLKPAAGTRVAQAAGAPRGAAPVSGGGRMPSRVRMELPAARVDADAPPAD
ncbi:lytic transglycosylase domain-containing protein [Xenophilus sp. Marseille-Q4582]|uniref:lytic transglycosylase domain-containing protein n=1 Tax=Xenophilus sp. Marseille-Q4582 TaxID=2866600 RepID=UPI001CE43C87|nr:lytic transglycosylase domain-containing protein [Xenophilus sp. Marseille-Q4582]